MQHVQDRLAAVEIRKACLIKTTPPRCRDIEQSVREMSLWEKFDVAGAKNAGYSDQEITAFLRERCLQACATVDRNEPNCRL